MGRMVKIIMLVLALCVMAACSDRYAVRQNPASGFPHRYSAFDYRVAWKQYQAGSDLMVEGVMKNVRYAFIDSLDLSVQLVGSDNRVRARDIAIPVPQYSRMDEVIPFTVRLKNVSPKSGDLLRFQIHYKASEGGENDGMDWRSNFEADAVTGEVLPKHEPLRDEW